MISCNALYVDQGCVFSCKASFRPVVKIPLSNKAVCFCVGPPMSTMDARFVVKPFCPLVRLPAANKFACFCCEEYVRPLARPPLSNEAVGCFVRPPMSTNVAYFLQSLFSSPCWASYLVYSMYYIVECV